MTALVAEDTACVFMGVAYPHHSPSVLVSTSEVEKLIRAGGGRESRNTITSLAMETCLFSLAGLLLWSSPSSPQHLQTLC